MRPSPPIRLASSLSIRGCEVRRCTSKYAYARHYQAPNGASDDHAKDFSIFLEPDGRFSLTHFDDMLSAQPAPARSQIAQRRSALRCRQALTATTGCPNSFAVTLSKLARQQGSALTSCAAPYRSYMTIRRTVSVKPVRQCRQTSQMKSMPASPLLSTGACRAPFARRRASKGA